MVLFGTARGGADRVDPGDTFHLQAPLPADAMRMQIYQLRWTSDSSHRAVLNRPHTSLDGLTPYEFANRSAKDHNVNRANL